MIVALLYILCCVVLLVIIGALFLGDDYEFDRSNRRDRANQLEDIRDWNSGNKSIAGEAIDKFKEIVGRVKFFDTGSAYPYVRLFVFWRPWTYQDAMDFPCTD